jgi:hypothetical protein
LIFHLHGALALARALCGKARIETQTRIGLVAGCARVRIEKAVEKAKLLPV